MSDELFNFLVLAGMSVASWFNGYYRGKAAQRRASQLNPR